MEALVFSRRAAADISKKASAEFELDIEPPEEIPDYSGAPVPLSIQDEIRAIMQRSYFVFPDTALARQGLKTINNILARLQKGKFKKDCAYEEILSLATVSAMVLKEIV